MRTIITTTKELNTYKKHAVILFAAWLLMQLVLLNHFGVVTGFEATKYIEQASYFIQNGTFTTGNFLYYSTEIQLIVLAKKIGLGYGFVVLIQILANAFSTIFFYRLIYRFSNKLSVAFWFTLSLIGMFYYQLYNVHLFTESLYFSFSILFLYYLTTINKLTFYSLVGLVLGLALLFFTRPVGIFFLPATFIYIVLKFYSKQALRIFLTAGVIFILMFIALLNKSLSSGGEFDFLLPYQQEQIICGISTVQTDHHLNVPGEKNSVQGLLYVITNHWQLFLSLFLRRLLAFFGVVRSYFSFAHNLFTGLYFYCLYLFSIAGIRKWDKIKSPSVAFLLCMIFLTALTSALSCDEWHGRFVYALLPFLMLLASFNFGAASPKQNQKQ